MISKKEALKKIEELKKYIQSLESIEKKTKHEIPGKTIYWGEEAEEKMNWYDAKEWCEEQGGRLPTRLELLQAHEDEIEGFYPYIYWSSSEDSSGDAWRQYFDSNGNQYGNNKKDLSRVRCVFDNN